MAYRATKTEIEAELKKQGIEDAQCKNLVNVVTGERTSIAYESKKRFMYWMFHLVEGETYELVDQGSMF
jgi:hypothetical protein